MNLIEDNQHVRSKEDARGMCKHPFVSIIMPVFNEEKFIERSLMAVLKQDYPPDLLEVIIADGMSTDRTREIVSAIRLKQPNVRLISNPQRIVPCGLNLAIAAARGDVIVRLDGHCEYPNDYVRRVVELRDRTGADNVGGVLVPMGTSYVQQAVAAAYHSPVGLGGAALRGNSPAGETVREVDAVHGGCWKRNRLLEVGGFDETMVRNQDDELSFRLRKSAGRILQNSAIRVKYHVRDSFRKLFLQFFQYGYWKVRVVRKHPRQASARHFIPGMFVLLLMASAASAPFSRIGFWTLLAMTGFYLSTLIIVTSVQRAVSFGLLPGVITALTMMHFGYGLGFLMGWAPGLRIFACSSR